MQYSDRIVSLDLDEKTIALRSLDIEQERKVAIYDLLEKNFFRLANVNVNGPYALKLSIEDNRLLFDICTAKGNPVVVIGLSLNPFRGLIRDYWEICESYFQAIRNATSSQIETIDMARRSVHNDGAELICDRLADKVELDLTTARRLFTLLCVLHLR